MFCPSLCLSPSPCLSITLMTQFSMLVPRLTFLPRSIFAFHTTDAFRLGRRSSLALRMGIPADRSCRAAHARWCKISADGPANLALVVVGLGLWPQEGLSIWGPWWEGCLGKGIYLWDCRFNQVTVVIPILISSTKPDLPWRKSAVVQGPYRTSFKGFKGLKSLGQKAGPLANPNCRL